MPSSYKTQRRNILNKRVRSQLQGSASVRRLLKQLPDAVREEMADILEEVGPKLLAAMQAEASYRTGAFRGALAWKVLRRSMRLRVGLITAASRRKAFYGRILEFGRKRQEVKIKKGKRAGSTMMLGAIAKRPLVYKKRPEIRNALHNRLNSLFDHALATAGQGGGDD